MDRIRTPYTFREKMRVGERGGQNQFKKKEKKSLYISNLEGWKSLVLGASVSCSYPALGRCRDLRIETMCAYLWSQDTKHYGLEPSH